MSQLPLDPTYAKALLCGAERGVAVHMLSLVSMLSVEGATFYAPQNKRSEADEARRRFVRWLEHKPQLIPLARHRAARPVVAR